MCVWPCHNMVRRPRDRAWRPGDCVDVTVSLQIQAALCVCDRVVTRPCGRVTEREG